MHKFKGRPVPWAWKFSTRCIGRGEIIRVTAKNVVQRGVENMLFNMDLDLLPRCHNRNLTQLLVGRIAFCSSRKWWSMRTRFICGTCSNRTWTLWLKRGVHLKGKGNERAKAMKRRIEWSVSPLMICKSTISIPDSPTTSLDFLSSVSKERVKLNAQSIY